MNRGGRGIGRRLNSINALTRVHRRTKGQRAANSKGNWKRAAYHPVGSWGMGGLLGTEWRGWEGGGGGGGGS